MRRTALATVLAVLALAAPAAAEPVTETADSGSVHAAFSYDRNGDQYSGLHLTVTDGGKTIVDRAIPDSDALQPGGYDGRPSVRALDLDGDGTVEVVLDLYTGGAHCCTQTWIYSGTAPKVVHDFRDIGYDPIDVNGDGRPEFVSADPAFAYAFTSFAGSRFPLQVFRWKAGHLRDVTRSAAVKPRLRKQARHFRFEYGVASGKFRRGQHGIAVTEVLRGTLPAYAADECSLGHCGTGLDLLRTARRRHELTKKQVAEMRRFLRNTGYLRG